jgi:hypothetical protein
MSVRRLVALCAAVVIALPCVAYAEMWSLAYPPLRAGTTTPDQSAPLPEWTLWQLFPTESRCEEHRALWLMVVKAQDDESIRAAGRRAVFAQGIPPPNANMDALEEAGRRWVVDTGAKLRKDVGAMNQVLIARCVSAADPRLAPKPK